MSGRGLGRTSQLPSSPCSCARLPSRSCSFTVGYKPIAVPGVECQHITCAPVCIVCINEMAEAGKDLCLNARTCEVPFTFESRRGDRNSKHGGATELLVASRLPPDVVTARFFAFE